MMLTSQLTLHSLVSALKWDGSSAMVAFEWKTAYLKLLSDRLITVVQADTSGLLMGAAEMMNQGEMSDLLLSPRISWRLLRDLGPDSVDALKVEMLRILDQCDTRDNAYEERRIEAGCLHCAGLLVDFRSSYDCPSREPGEARLEHLSPEIEASAFVSFKHALSLLEETAPRVYGFVQALTTRVVFRFDARQPSGFASGSFRGHAGLTLISNPQALIADPLRLIDALVHESVHAAIYMYEPLVTRLCRINPSELRVRSCWTGVMLTLDQYVQACFVWWGLLNLWSFWLDHEIGRQGNSLFGRPLRGFCVRPVSALRRQISDRYLDEHTWSALREIEEEAMAEIDHHKSIVGKLAPAI